MFDKGSEIDRILAKHNPNAVVADEDAAYKLVARVSAEGVDVVSGRFQT